jgi:hypothetical protein
MDRTRPSPPSGEPPESHSGSLSPRSPLSLGLNPAADPLAWVPLPAHRTPCAPCAPHAPWLTPSASIHSARSASVSYTLGRMRIHDSSGRCGCPAALVARKRPVRLGESAPRMIRGLFATYVLANVTDFSLGTRPGREPAEPTEGMPLSCAAFLRAPECRRRSRDAFDRGLP